jgi:hypothetical protein
MPLDPPLTGIVFHPSWPAPAQALLRRAIDRHGGWSLWQRLEAVTVGLTSLRGFLAWLKGSGHTFHLARSLTTFPASVRTEWSEGAKGPRVAIFDRGDMRLFDPATGRVVAESLDHRRTFRGLRKLRRWTALDAHYFFGYAFASYMAVPFILPGLVYAGPASAWVRRERLSGVRVQFPAGAEVHSRSQRYFFDGSGLIRRNDYVADVVGAWAVGAHFWDDFVTVEGLPLPARRKVFLRLGPGHAPWPAVLDATFQDLAVRVAPAPAAPRSRPGAAPLDLQDDV